MTLRSELDALASAVCEKAQLEATPIEASTDALKAVTTYYAVCAKVDAKSGGVEDGDIASFDSFSADIHGASQENPNGRPAKPPANRRRDS